jgi:hypothetical protein
MHYIRYGPWGQPHPLAIGIGNWLNISKSIEIPTPKPCILVPCVTIKICNTLDMAPGVNPTPQEIRN